MNIEFKRQLLNYLAYVRTIKGGDYLIERNVAVVVADDLAATVVQATHHQSSNNHLKISKLLANQLNKQPAKQQYIIENDAIQDANSERCWHNV
jgi:hypothetical protein